MGTNPPADVEADPAKRIAALETKVSDLETRIEVLERLASDRYR